MKWNTSLSKKGLFVILVYASTLIAISAFFVDLKNARAGGQVDLRNRIVGARLLKTQYSSYFFKWQNGITDQLLDPRDTPQYEFNRVTVPPSVLQLHRLISWLSYSHIRIIWFLFQYFCICFIVFVFITMAKTKERRWSILIASCLFFLGSVAWRVHIDVGQIYIFYTTILTTAFWLYKRQTPIGVLCSGVLVGLLIWLRPPVLVVLMPFLFAGKFKFVSGSIVGMLIGLCTIFFLGRTSDWTDYYKAMNKWAELRLKENKVIDSTVQYPKIVEGRNNMPVSLDVKNEQLLTVQMSAYRYFNIKLRPPMLILMYLISVSFLLFLIRDRLRVGVVWELFVIGFLCYTFIEYFLPAPKMVYNYVQWIFPLLLICIEGTMVVSPFFIGLVGGLLLNTGAFGWNSYHNNIGELLVFICIYLIIKMPALAKPNSALQTNT